MSSRRELAEEFEIPQDALHYNVARHKINGQAPSNVDGNTAITASTTYYTLLGILPRPATLESLDIRSEAAGVAGATIDILKVPSGTAVGAGTAVVTQIAGNALTAATNYAMTVTAAAKNFAAGDALVAKIVGGAAETLKPLLVKAVFK